MLFGVHFQLRQHCPGTQVQCSATQFRNINRFLNVVQPGFPQCGLVIIIQVVWKQNVWYVSSSFYCTEILLLDVDWYILAASPLTQSQIWISIIHILDTYELVVIFRAFLFPDDQHIKSGFRADKGKANVAELKVRCVFVTKSIIEIVWYCISIVKTTPINMYISLSDS